MGQIVLCADRESIMHPTLLGLEEGSLGGSDWLVAFPSAAEVRAFVAAHDDVAEVWVVGCDDLAGINLAAALRKDAPELPIFLVVSDASGSELSRAAQAGVTAALTPAAFRARHDAEARRRAIVDEAVDLGMEPDEAIAGAPTQAAKGASAARGEAASAGVAPRSDVAESAGVAARPGVAPSALAAATPDAAAPNAATLDAAAPNVAPRGDVAEDAPHSALRPAAQRTGTAFVVSFLSGGGGVGKSAVTAVSAHRSAARGLSVVAVDCDLQFGDVRHLMGARDALTIDDVMADPAVVPALRDATAPGVPAVIGAPARLERSESLAGRLGELLDTCAAWFDVVVVNTGGCWTEGHAHLLERSAASGFLMDQRASSVYACRHALDLCMRLGIASAPFAFALNRCRRGALFGAVDIANSLQGAHVFELKDGGGEVEEMLGAGLAADLATAKNDFCMSVDAMLDELLPADGAACGKKGHLLERRPRRPKAKAVTGSPRARAEVRGAGMGRPSKARGAR